MSTKLENIKVITEKVQPLEGRYPNPDEPEDNQDGQPFEYFEIKDQTYINNLKILQTKLQRYRWIYYQSTDHYGHKSDKYIYYPTLVFTTIISILSLIAAASSNANRDVELMKTVFNYIIATLSILIATLQKIQTKKLFDVKHVKFETAGHEIDKLVSRVSHEIKFPDDDPYQFVSSVEDHFIKIKNDLVFKPPTYITNSYTKMKLENPNDISSEEIQIKTKTLGEKVPLISAMQQKIGCYDYDIEDEMKARKEQETKHQNIMSKYNETILKHNGHNNRPMTPSQYI